MTFAVHLRPFLNLRSQFQTVPPADSDTTADQAGKCGRKPFTVTLAGSEAKSVVPDIIIFPIDPTILGDLTAYNAL